MKTNRSPSRSRTISFLLLCLAVAALMTVGFQFHQRSLARHDQDPSPFSQTPKLDLSALLAAH